MKKERFYRGWIILAVLLAAGGFYRVSAVQADTFQVPEVEKINMKPSGLLVAEKPAIIECEITGYGEKTLSKQQVTYLEKHGWKLPGEVRVDNKIIKPFSAGATKSFTHYFMSTGWTPAMADAGKTHTLSCVIDPKNVIYASSETTSVKVVTKLPPAARRLPGVVNKQALTGAQAKPASVAPKGDALSQGKPAAANTLAPGIVAPSPLPDLIISELRVVGAIGCFPDGTRNFMLQALVTNIGSGPVEGNGDVKFYVKQVPIPGSVSIDVETQNLTGRLSSGKSVWFKGELKKIGEQTVGTKAVYNFYAKVDSVGMIKEVNEQNNEKKLKSDALQSCAPASKPASQPGQPAPQAQSPASRRAPGRLKLPSR